MAVQRIYVEKRPEHAVEAKGLLAEFRGLLGVKGLTGLRILNRYDVEGMAPEQFRQAVPVVFSEPQLDIVSETIEAQGAVFAVEFLPGQFDQRADSAAQCIQIISQGERPVVRTAKVYVLEGALRESDVAAVKKYVINPVEAREAELARQGALPGALEPGDPLRLHWQDLSGLPEYAGTVERLRGLLFTYRDAWESEHPYSKAFWGNF